MDINNIENEIFKNVTDYGKESIAKMKILWQHLYGDTESIFLERYKSIEVHLKTLMDEMVKEEEEAVVEYKDALATLVACRQNLQEELRMNIDLSIDIDPEKPDLYNRVKKLTDCIKKYEVIKINRLQELNMYKDAEEELCERLDEEPKYISFATVPSEEQLEEIKNHIQSLRVEEMERSNSCNSLISEIEELISDLELTDIDLEKRNILNRDASVPLSKLRIANLEEWKTELIALKDEQIRNIIELKEKTILLWNLLDIDGDERSRIFNKTFKECGQTVLNIWTKELERCAEMKKQNIQTVILRLREVIKNLWDDCHISEEERLSFIDFYNDSYDDILLQSHELEEQRLRLYYKERKEIFTLAKKWFTLWDKMILLENRSNNTGRYNNRGGQLLKEERERKAVQKELPKVESALEKLIADTEERTKQPFFYDGRPLLKKIEELWEHRRTEKENEKEIRKTQNQNRMTPLKPTNGTVTPLPSAQKRGKIMTENMSARKPIMAKRELKMPASAKKTVRRRSRSHDPQGRYEDEKLKQESDIIDASIGSYAGFQGYLENISKSMKNGMPLRSSVSPIPSVESDNADRTILVFKTPSNVIKSTPKKPTPVKKLGSYRFFRPMLY